MCGIAGYAGERPADLEAMAAAIRHRGPDDSGFYRDAWAGLAHRRLSIIDLDTGRQPIANEDGTLVIIYNGEMYNFREERALLEKKGHRFRTRTDTEVILHLYEEYGTDAFARINGEFAVALWDARARRMVLARDRYGIKPLFYHRSGGCLYFASEIRSLLQSGRVEKALSPEAVRNYFNTRYNASPHSIFRGVDKLPPATWLEFSAAGVRTGRYYAVSFDDGPRLSIGPQEAAEEVARLLADAVRVRLFADVEVGLFLSAGIDSSSILALAAAHRQRLKTFSIGFGSADDESGRACALARQFGANARSFAMSGADLPRLCEAVRCFDEPIGDAIILPIWELARRTAAEVKVVLSGDGADEVFGGYIHHLAAFHIQRHLSRAPRPLLGLLGRALLATPLPLLNAVFPYPDKLRAADREKVAGFLAQARDYSATRQRMTRLWQDDAFAGPALLPPRRDPSRAPANAFFGQLDDDLATWLPDYTLYQRDTLTMAHGLEARVPFLDHRLVDFVSRLPYGLFARGMEVKTILRRAMAGRLPRASVKNRKQAFYFPYYKGVTRAFLDETTDRFRAMAADPDFTGLLSEKAFMDCVAGFGERSSLVETKRFMQYVIFLYWYQSRFAETA